MVQEATKSKKMTPSNPPSIRPGYHLFSSKIQMISRIRRTDERDLNYLHKKISLKGL